MVDRIEPATSGRAKCRGCGNKIPKGELRFGEVVADPFGTGEATWWFHVPCAALKRPERFVELETIPDGVDHVERLRQWAQQGIEHYRLARIKCAERARSGRAHCRQCKEPIALRLWRIVVEIWEEGRFTPIGFVHATCAPQYFGTPLLIDRICHFTPELTEADLQEVSEAIDNRTQTTVVYSPSH